MSKNEIKKMLEYNEKIKKEKSEKEMPKKKSIGTMLLTAIKNEDPRAIEMVFDKLYDDWME